MNGWVDGCQTIIHSSTHPIIPFGCAQRLPWQKSAGRALRPALARSPPQETQAHLLPLTPWMAVPLAWMAIHHLPIASPLRPEL